MIKIHKIKITEKRLNALRNKENIFVSSSAHGTNIKISDQYAIEHDFKPFELWFIKTAELLPDEVYSNGKYHFNEVIEIPENSEKIAIHRHKTTDNYFIKYESVPMVAVDDMTPDFIFNIENGMVE